MRAEDRAVVLQARGLGFRWHGTTLIADLDADIPSGLTWVHGGEGRGKTTLLRLLAADLKAQCGTLQLAGIRLADDANAYRQQVFWVDPRTDAWDGHTAQAYWDSLPARYVRFDWDLLLELVERLDLTPHQHKALYMLSTGTKRKVWLAAAFASGARVTLLDEPFAALDKPSIACALDLLQEAAAHSSRAWVVADYVAPRNVPLASTIDLGD